MTALIIALLLSHRKPDRLTWCHDRFVWLEDLEHIEKSDVEACVKEVADKLVRPYTTDRKAGVAVDCYTRSSGSMRSAACGAPLAAAGACERSLSSAPLRERTPLRSCAEISGVARAHLRGWGGFAR